MASISELEEVKAEGDRARISALEQQIGDLLTRMKNVEAEQKLPAVTERYSIQDLSNRVFDVNGIIAYIVQCDRTNPLAAASWEVWRRAFRGDMAGCIMLRKGCLLYTSPSPRD